MRFTSARLSAIDAFVADLSLCLPGNYDDACKLATGFMRSHTGRVVIDPDESLFYGDPADLESLRGRLTGRGALGAYFPTNAAATENLLSDDEAIALCELLSRLPPFVLDGVTNHRRRKLIEEMSDLCSDYLELRGLQTLVPTHENRRSLAPQYQKALELIRSLPGPTKGRTIANKLGVRLITFQKHYVPALRPFGLKNKGGYFIDEKSS